MANNPELLKMPLARDGQKNTIPETATASAGIFSQQYGWQSINALPPQAGGKAVKREDFNGAFNLLGGIAFMSQKGFTFKWSAEQDYYAGCVVIDDTDGLRYECIADVTANSTAPSSDATHWQIFSAGTDINAWFRQPSTVYANGAIALLLTLPTGWYLENTGTSGTTSANDLVISSPTVGATVNDGTVVWTIRKVTNYSLPVATSTVLGGVRTGANITNTNGTISVSKTNVTKALGYTPPTTNTTYSTGTATYSGTTKLYTGLGDNTDGSMTQKAIKASVGKGYLTASSYDASTGAWYRKYSDGWVEQGGRTGFMDTNLNLTINLITPMADTGYNVVFGMIQTDTNWDAYNNKMPLVRARETTSFRCCALTEQKSGVVWVAFGKGA
jgi:hypothetical protein